METMDGRWEAVNEGNASGTAEGNAEDTAGSGGMSMC